MPTTLRRAATTALATAALITGAILGGAGTASAQHQYGDRLNRGESLQPGEMIQRSIWDPIANLQVWYRLVMQTDGNLVEYKIHRYGQSVCWATNTYPYSGNYAVYQSDGNFVLYTSGGHALWASHTMGLPGETVDINRNGVVYAGHTPFTGSC
ncbi:hypothetical protein [Streptomyces sp. NBC_01244]|uniref:hypothetical protein n=1 Tax=Streptomyces sp. NBC_01244 TaxID=2903797 RepID=UPI002E0EB857|nr:hypothetical protein OG247_01815 [Streptomyces sp. NBC_01244]